jgi:very-short-patch-repair endonuclease
MTPPEIALWLQLRQNSIGLSFRRQYPAGAYVLDFYCVPAMLAVEIDGEAHSRGDRPKHDQARDAWLASRGVHVLRYSAAEVAANLPGVVEHILSAAVDRRATLAGASHPPPPSGPA